jgi:hypothetical protein
LSDSFVAGAIAAVIGAVVAGLFVLVGGSLVYSRERRLRRRERLRSLYGDVMLAALRLVPYEFGHRLSEDVGSTTAQQIDGLAARLRLEAWIDGDHVLEELQSVYHAVLEWERQKEQGARISDLMNPARQEVLRSLERVELAMRASLGTSPAPLISSRRGD